ncbi:MAG: hypothetical protein KGM44_04540 [bacterium]|nr:hypothetical protein [bacterium]
MTVARPLTAVRGSALAETAITLSFTLLLLFGAMQIALVGYFQMELDGALFQFAHNYALGVTDQAGLNQIDQIFPNVPLSSITFNAASPPLTNVPVNFTQWGTLTNRYGGASIIRPQRLQTSAQLQIGGLSSLGNNVTLTAGDVEGRYMTSNHDDDAQGAGYNSATVFNTQENPFTQDDQNVPPYYFNFGFIWYCSPLDMVGDQCAGQQLRSLGLAEYLKDGPDTVDGNYDLATSGVAPNQTFQAMGCHQRIYAQLIATFSADYAAARAAWLADPSNNIYNETVSQPLTIASVNLIYQWDVMPIQGAGVGPLLGQQWPLYPLIGCAPGQAGG